MNTEANNKIGPLLNVKETESVQSPLNNYIPTNRRQRRADIKIWNKMLAKHMKLKPEYNVSDPNNLTETDFAGLEKIREWTATFINIKKKLSNLGVK